ncbi:zinc finger HIT domain-containing protein 1 [Gongronella butleri]|nr:zinc finger HIT domain-containing protein 1 [Gongronella butleri]
MKKTDRSKSTRVRVDPEAHQRHLKRQLDSLERDNHQSLNDVEGLISIALAAQEQKDDAPAPRKARSKLNRSSVYSAKTNLNVLLEDAHLEGLPLDVPTYHSCQADASQYPPRHFCSVCGYTSAYKCLRCGMKYCSVRCLETHRDTRCLKWTV